MQRVSNRMADTIDFMYAAIGTLNKTYGNLSQLNYEDNNVYTLFLNIKAHENKVEIPIFCKDNILRALYSSCPNHTINISIPFIRDIISISTFRSSDPLIRHLTYYAPTQANMFSVTKTVKGEEYYGNCGLIFDKDMNLLLLNTIEYEIKENSDNAINFYARKVKVYVHPLVFYTDGTVEKCIINKIIPYSLQKGISINNSHIGAVRNCVNFDDPVNYRGFHRAIPEIIVTDIKDKFFYEPVLPSVSINNNDINEMLERNVEEVLNIL